MFSNITDRIRLLFRKDKESYFRFYKMLGFYPRNISIYEQALLHKSSSIKSEQGRLLNNERLEFLGDAILDAVVADIVYKKFEGKREGFLTNTRSKIVQRETLNRLAIEIGLDKLIKYSARQSSHNSYMCGNAFEALVGAIYLDRGYRACKHFMEHRIIGPYINLEKISRKEVNFKSKLIEWSQKNRVELTFELITQSHDQCFSPTFESEVLIEGIPAGRGIGYSKKESQQRAAHEAMGKIKDSVFMESVLAAKSVREAPQEEVMLPREEAVETVISAVSEEIGISELNEQIISEAEEMAFKEVK
ncbi:ribonuclease III [Phocaeicola massiliensis]|mgnify:FL=1|uniref:ribonuclease III n=1 Tax=Phocaeicola massiliensis TaxID=204516 RepID=UPI000E40D0F4|nr:ribonuclease III [Phocaeicola massiliensis]RGE99525.1 ribonuclease III [Bacteroides sp. AM22-3LB]